MMPDVRSYNFNDVTVRVDGRVITGYADGTGIECEKSEDNFQTSAGVDGDTIVSENNDNRGVITITLDQTSPSCSFLDGLANSQRQYPARVIDSSDRREKAGGNKARVRKPADKSYGRESGERQYEIEVFDYRAE